MPLAKCMDSVLENLLSLTGKMGCDKEEGSAKKGKSDSHSPLGLDLRDDPSCDCGVLHFCVVQQSKCCG